MRARGMGANVIVTEIKPTAALKATLDGFRVMPMDEAATVGDIFITATGMKDVIVGRHFDVDEGRRHGLQHRPLRLRDQPRRPRGAAPRSKREIRANNEEYTLKDGRRIYVLAKGRLVNLAAAEGHPSEVMDMSFANQFLALCKLAKDGKGMKPGVYELPAAQDQELALIKLGTQGMRIDKLTPEQVEVPGRLLRRDVGRRGRGVRRRTEWGDVGTPAR